MRGTHDLATQLLVSEAGDFNPIYLELYLNFREGGNLTERIDRIVEQGELKNVELFFFAANLVFYSVFYKGTSKRPLLFELVLHLHQMQMKV